MDQVKFVDDSLLKAWSDMVCLSSSTNFIWPILKYFLPYILNSKDLLEVRNVAIRENKGGAIKLVGK